MSVERSCSIRTLKLLLNNYPFGTNKPLFSADVGVILLTWIIVLELDDSSTSVNGYALSVAATAIAVTVFLAWYVIRETMKAFNAASEAKENAMEARQTET